MLGLSKKLGTLKGRGLNIVSQHIKWIMLDVEVLTCTMVHAAIAPQDALRATFGETWASRLPNMLSANGVY